MQAVPAQPARNPGLLAGPAELGKALGHGYDVEITPGQSGSVGLYRDIDTSLIQLLIPGGCTSHRTP
jgi:hypothetical protein